MSAPANSAVYVDPSTGAISTGAVQFRNRIINGDMRIDQRLAGTANAALLTGQDVYTADRWAVWRNASGANYTVQRIANAGAPGNDFALQATVTSSATPGTNDIYFMHQKIEGYNVNDFGLGTANAAFFTISFHVRSSVTGTFGLIATNAAKNRSYATTYIVNAANVWEYKVITIKGDVAGVWAKDNTTGLDIIWSLGAGSGASTAAGAAWNAGGFYNVTGAVQFVGGAVGATFAISNVQVERGSAATPFEVRPFAMEYSLCIRYYEVFGKSGTGIQNRFLGYQAGTLMISKFDWPTKRAIPAVAFSTSASTPTIIYKTGGTTSFSSGFSYVSSPQGMYLNWEGMTSAGGYGLHIDIGNGATNTTFEVSAEL